MPLPAHCLHFIGSGMEAVRLAEEPAGWTDCPCVPPGCEGL